MNIFTKYGFDILIIFGSYGGHRRHTTYDGRQTKDDRQRHGYGISSPQGANENSRTLFKTSVKIISQINC